MPELAQWKNLAVQLSCMMKQLCVKGQDLTVNSLDAYTTNTIDNIKDQTGRMYFQTPFPVPSLNQLSLHHREDLRSFCSMPDFCHHNYFGH